MYILIYTLIFCIVLYLNLAIKRPILNISNLFTGIWALSGSISSLGLYEIYKPSTITHVFIITVILTFNFIYFLFNKNKKNDDESIKKEYIGYPRVIIIVIVNLLCWFYVQDTLNKSINIIFAQGFNVLRGYAFNSEMGLASSLKLFIIQNIVQAVFIATIIITLVYKNLNKTILILFVFSIIDVIIYTLLFGGRSLILLLALSYIFSYIVQKPKKIQFKKKNYIYAFFLFLSMNWLTNLRSWNDDSFIKNIVLYFSGSFSYFSVLFNNIDVNSNNYLLGKATLGFLYNPINMFFSFIYKYPYLGSDVIITQITATPVYISPTQTYNAVTSLLFPFYMDFGFLGILFGATFFSLLSVFIETKSRESNHIVFKILYIYMLICIFDSIMTYQLLFIKTGFIILFIILFINQKRKTVINNE